MNQDFLFNQSKIILDLCGGTGSWSKPYKDADYDVRNITLPEYDVRTYILSDNVYGILAAPPCDEFSISREGFLFGTNKMQERNEGQGMNIVNACYRIIFQARPKKFWALENPVGLLRKYLGEPTYIFQPWWFGDPWTKKTYLWGHFNFPARKYLNWKDVPKNNDLYIRPGREKPSIAFLHKSSMKFVSWMREYEDIVKNDADFRAITPKGFAMAFFEANR